LVSRFEFGVFAFASRGGPRKEEVFVTDGKKHGKRFAVRSHQTELFESSQGRENYAVFGASVMPIT
jgi:hypothetical protein